MDRTRATIAAAAVLSAMAIAGARLRVGDTHAAAPFGLDRVALSDRDFVDEALDAEFLDVLRAREVLFRTYHPNADEPVWVFLCYFDRQREGSQVHSPRHCYPGSGWNIEEESSVPAPWREGVLPTLVVSNGAERRLVCFWYQTPFATEVDVLRLKLSLTRLAILRRPQDVVFASVSTPIGGDPDRARDRAVAVALDLEDEIERLYASAGKRP